MSTQTANQAASAGCAISNSAQNQSVLAKQDGKIVQESLHLEHSIEYLETLIDSLKDKIQPILSIEQPSLGNCIGNDAQSIPEYSQVSATLIHMRNKIDGVSSRLNGLLDRIEL